MEKIKFIKPLFDTKYFNNLFLNKINFLLEKDINKIVNDWIMITLYNPIQGVDETQSTAIISWKQEHYCASQPVYSAILSVEENGHIIPNSTKPIGFKNASIHQFDLIDVANKEQYYDTCFNNKFMYLWYSIHKGPHELPMHIDKKSGLRYVQCIYKNGKHNDWWYDGDYLVLNEGDAFVFDPKAKHSVVTETDCESVFLIADCPEWSIDEFNV